MLKVGDKLPAVTLSEYVAVEGEGCAIGPASFEVAKEAAGKTIALFAVPGAFTPGCSLQHLPGYVQQAGALKAAGVDEIWCLSVNDAFVMGAWGRDQGTAGKVRMLGDGSAEFTKAVGLVFDLSSRGLGIRSQRYSALIVNGAVKTLNVESTPGVEVSRAERLLEQLRELGK